MTTKTTAKQALGGEGSAPVATKRDYQSPVLLVEVYSVERGFASSGNFETIIESGTNYGRSNFF
ncbi:MAG: hypothetical protein IJU81_00770 [Bacteroidales bacterium]|nr:hypothetical protein [Bacteroidales bacterium]